MLSSSIIFTTCYTHSREFYNGTTFLVSAAILVVPTVVIAYMEGLFSGIISKPQENNTA
jgi:hypothetical protein